MVVYPPAVATARIGCQQGRQKVSKGSRARFLIGYAKLIQGLHERGHDLYPHSIALIAQQVQKWPAANMACIRLITFAALSDLHS